MLKICLFDSLRVDRSPFHQSYIDFWLRFAGYETVKSSFPLIKLSPVHSSEAFEMLRYFYSEIQIKKHLAAPVVYPESFIVSRVISGTSS